MKPVKPLAWGPPLHGAPGAPVNGRTSFFTNTKPPMQTVTVRQKTSVAKYGFIYVREIIVLLSLSSGAAAAAAMHGIVIT